MCSTMQIKVLVNVQNNAEMHCLTTSSFIKNQLRLLRCKKQRKVRGSVIVGKTETAKRPSFIPCELILGWEARV